MEQQEYDEILFRDQLVKSIEDKSASDNKAPFLGVDIAVATSLSSIDSKLGTANKTLATLSSVQLASTNKTLQAIDDKLHASNHFLASIMAKMYGKSVESIQQSAPQTKVDYSQQTMFATAILNLAEFVASNQNLRKFSKNANAFAKAMDLLFVPIDKFIDRHTDVNAVISTLSGLTSVLDSVAKSLSEFGKTMLMVVGSIAAMTALVAIADLQTLLIGAGVFSAVVIALTVGITYMSKHVSSADLVGVQNFAMAVAIMSAALLPMKLLTIGDALTGAAALGATSLALATSFALATKLMPDTKKTAEFNKSIFIFAGAIVALSAATVLLGLVAQLTPWTALAKGAALVLVAGATLAIAGKAMQSGSKDIGIATGLFVLSLAALGLVVIEFQKIIEQTDWTAWAAVGTAMLVLAGSIWVIGRSNMTWKGIAAIAALSASLLVIAYATKQFNEIAWEDLGKAGTVIGGLVALMYAAGAGGGIALLGAAAIAVGAGALAAASFAIKAFGQNIATYPLDITVDDYKLIAKGLGIIAGTVALIGNPLTIIPLLAGVAAIHKLGKALSSTAEGINATAKVNMPNALQSANSVVDWAKSALAKLGSTSIKDALKSDVVLRPFAKLGTALASLAIGVNAMAAGQFNEYAIKDGQQVIVATHKIGPAEYTKVGESIEALLNSITDPLAKFGAGGGWFSKADTVKGMDALSHIGDIINPMIAVATEADKIANANYANFGIALTKLVDGIKDPLSTLASDSGWFNKGNFAKGITALSNIDKLVQPMIAVADNASKIAETDFDVIGPGLHTLILGVNDSIAIVKENTEFAKLTETTSTAIDSIFTSLSKAAEIDKALPENWKLAAGISATTDAIGKLDMPNVKLLVEAATAIDSIANANLSQVTRAKNAVSKQLFERLDELAKNLQAIATNTKPQELKPSMIKIDKETGEPESAFRLEDDTEVDITTIAIQLDQLYGLLASQR